MADSLGIKLMKIQTELKAPKNLYNSFGNYSYRNAEGIQEAVKPFLKKHNCVLTLTDEIVEVGGRIYVKAVAVLNDCDSDTQFAVKAYAREAETKKGMDEAQITGATSSYARKYALNGLFLLDDTKDVDSEEYQAPAQKTTQKNTQKTYREQLREYCIANNIDGREVARKYGLHKESTEEDYKQTLAYVMQGG